MIPSFYMTLLMPYLMVYLLSISLKEGCYVSCNQATVETEYKILRKLCHIAKVIGRLNSHCHPYSLERQSRRFESFLGRMSVSLK